MMEQAFWLILFLAVVGIAALIAAAMMWQKESIQQPGTPTGQRSYQEEYSAPDFTESAGFAVTMYPSTDILIPGRFWLINRKTAEIEYNVIPAGGVRLRVAQTGQLDATLALGSAELGTVQAERVTIENAQGDVTISRLVGASQVQVTDQLGNIALTLGEKADGYSVQAACGLGSITVSGAKQASPYSANSKAANAVILDAALGDITLNFEE
jgi:hypothetical protein